LVTLASSDFSLTFFAASWRGLALATLVASPGLWFMFGRLKRLFAQEKSPANMSPAEIIELLSNVPDLLDQIAVESERPQPNKDSQTLSSAVEHLRKWNPNKTHLIAGLQHLVADPTSDPKTIKDATEMLRQLELDEMKNDPTAFVADLNSKHSRKKEAFGSHEFSTDSQVD